MYSPFNALNDLPSYLFQIDARMCLFRGEAKTAAANNVKTFGFHVGTGVHVRKVNDLLYRFQYIYPTVVCTYGCSYLSLLICLGCKCQCIKAIRKCGHNRRDARILFRRAKWSYDQIPYKIQSYPRCLDSYGCAHLCGSK